MSILEISHRSKTFEAIIAQAEADIRDASPAIPDDYRILFLQGGASLQFSMVPMNLLTEGRTADYLMTGIVGRQGGQGSPQGRHRSTRRGSTEADGYSRIPADVGVRSSTPGAAYVHMTSNNTIEGTEWQRLPEVGDAPLVCDASSDIFSRPIDVARYGLIYAGAQKNLGPSGVTLVIIREDLLARSAEDASDDAQLRGPGREQLALQHAARRSGSTCSDSSSSGCSDLGGLTAIEAINERKAGRLYAELDRTGFWRPTAARDSRSLMNVTFRLASEELEKPPSSRRRPRPASTA